MCIVMIQLLLHDFTDIDHMNNFMDFTLNPETYPKEKLRPYVDRLHRNHQKFIVILDPSKTISHPN